MALIVGMVLSLDDRARMIMRTISLNSFLSPDTERVPTRSTEY
jgi:hypothetical protein